MEFSLLFLQRKRTCAKNEQPIGILMMTGAQHDTRKTLFNLEWAVHTVYFLLCTISYSFNSDITF